MDRRKFIVASTALAGTSLGGAPAAPATGEELSVDEILARCADGSHTARELTQGYLERIEQTNLRGPALRAVIEVNPAALEVAAERDAERRRGTLRGPLHGVPVLVKDNIETQDRLMTTAGSLALQGWYSPQDAPLIARLRAAGAVILGKTNLSEWANMRSTHSISGWSARGGQTRNPHALDRSPSGSSSGSAVAAAANLCALAIGTETDGSIVSPASVNGIVGIKPTVGLISRRGIAPISHSQDTAGPLARSVRDAALLLGVLCGRDPADPASLAVGARFEADYTRFVDPDGLQGARLGIARKFFAENAPLDAALNRCIALLKEAGATIVDPADLPLHGTFDAAELEVLLYEYRSDLNAYLQRLSPALPVRDLDALIRFNEAHRDTEMPFFGQELLLQAQTKGPLTDPAYGEARARCLQATRTQGIDALLSAHKLDALVTLTAGPAPLIDPVNGDYDTGGCSSPAAVAGYPHITVPAGLHRGLPLGLSFFGAAFTEGTLIRLASGFEHVCQGRTRPSLRASIRV